MVNDEVTKVRVNGDGSTKTVIFAFKYSSDSSIKVYKIATDVTPEVATLQVLNTDYTVAAGSPQGGVVTFTTAPTVDEDGFVKLDEPYTQAVDIPSAGVFREEALEAGLDKPVLLCQQLREEVSRAIRLPETSLITSVAFGEPVADRALVWQDDGGGAWTAVSSASNPDDAATYAAAAAASAVEAAAQADLAAAQVDLAEAQVTLAATQAGIATAAAAASAVTAASSASTATTQAGIATTQAGIATAAASLMPDPTGNGLEILRANTGGTANEYSGVTISTDGTFASDADTKVPTEKAVKTYVGSNKGYRYVERSPEASSEDGTNQQPSSFIDYDLSSVVPSGAKLVKISFKLACDSGSARITIRKNGQTGTRQVQRVYTTTSVSEANAVFDVPCDTNRIIEISGDGLTSGNNFAYTILGWWV